MKKVMPDVALRAQKLDLSPLTWVGMKNIEIPILLSNQILTPAKITAQVSLDKKAARGIHMSRLYQAIQSRCASEQLSWSLLKNLTQDFLASHMDLSSNSKLQFNFKLNIKRKSLVSENYFYRAYPVKQTYKKINEKTFRSLEVLVTYSSTCPASAALARQLVQENFAANFKSEHVNSQEILNWLGTSEGINATPHAQRSLARVRVLLAESAELAGAELTAEQLIDLIEQALQTPVQGVVKREDEQEFALRNGQNLMFCEDAARRVQAALLTVPSIKTYRAEFRHLESLHPHDAVAEIHGSR